MKTDGYAGWLCGPKAISREPDEFGSCLPKRTHFDTISIGLAFALDARRKNDPTYESRFQVVRCLSNWHVVGPDC